MMHQLKFLALLPIISAATAQYTSLLPPTATGELSLITPLVTSLAPAASAIIPITTAIPTGPATFPQLPPLPASAIPNVTLPAINSSTNTTAGRFYLSAITYLTNPLVESLTNGSLAQALNHSSLVFTPDVINATVWFSSSPAIPPLATFELDEDCFQTWDGHVAYVDAGDGANNASLPVRFGEWDLLSETQQAGRLSCHFPDDEASFWAGDVAEARELCCTANSNAVELKQLSVCGNGPFNGDLIIEEELTANCVPLRLSAVGAGEPGVSVGADLRKHKRGVHKRW